MIEKLKRKLSLHQFILEALSVLGIIALYIAFFILYSKADAVIERKEGFTITSIAKTKVLVLPVVCLIVFFMISFLQFFPGLWEDNTERVSNKAIIENMKLMISYTKLLFLAAFAYLSIKSILGDKLGAWFVPLVIIVAVAEISYFLLRFAFLLKKQRETRRDGRTSAGLSEQELDKLKEEIRQQMLEGKESGDSKDE